MNQVEKPQQINFPPRPQLLQKILELQLQANLNLEVDILRQYKPFAELDLNVFCEVWFCSKQAQKLPPPIKALLQ